ncbi:MAG: UDP-N-acetylmuramoyl-tripeptide--D-alanyl-D-alanine ligase [Alphaproteobacteria bacterium]|nr:MAG: UDP-N-acetylmuramoyl-tripeptide--D-alanyl-D-alanine ligase [Alphaproteobacteria bacterium]
MKIPNALLSDNIRDNSYSVGISINSKTTLPNQIFFCIQGAKVDGHEFANEAIAKGASYVVASKNIHNIDQSKLIIVDSVEQKLSQITNYLLTQQKAIVIAVTGSAGKTSTKQMLQHVFQNYDSIASEGNYNTIYGIALTVCNAEHIPHYYILELGISHPGEMELMAKTVQPTYSIITNIGPAHLQHLHDVETIAKEKSVLLKFTKTKAFFPEICKKYCPKNLDYEITDDTKYQDFNEANKYPVLQVAKVENISNAEQKLATFKNTSRRNNLLKFTKANQSFTLIDSSYNSNPVSLKASLKQLSTFPNRKIAVLAEMKELGHESQLYHQQVDTYINADMVLLLGEIWQHNQGIKFNDSHELCKFLDNTIENGDVILVKGSNSTDAHLIVQHIYATYQLVE